MIDLTAELQWAAEQAADNDKTVQPDRRMQRLWRLINALNTQRISEDRHYLDTENERSRHIAQLRERLHRIRKITEESS